MAEQQPITSLTKYPGQIWQKTDEEGVGNGFDSLTGPDGKMHRDISGRTVHAKIDDIRAMGANGIPDANPNIQYLTKDFDCPGTWVVDESDTTTEDDGAICIVTAGGDRVKRKFNGDINAEWFGVNPNLDDNSVPLQAAIDVAQNLGCNVYLLRDGTYYTKNPFIVKQYVKLKLGEFTKIKQDAEYKYVVRIEVSGLITGGSISVAYANTAAIFICGRDGTQFGNRPQLLADNVIVRSNHLAGQKGIAMYIGCDEDMNASDSSDGDYIVTCAFRNVRLLYIDYGIDIQDMSTNKGTTGWINGINFHGNISAAKGITIGQIPMISSGHNFEGTIQSFKLNRFTGVTEKWAIKTSNTVYSNFSMFVYDWVPEGVNKYAVTVLGGWCTVKGLVYVDSVYVNLRGRSFITDTSLIGMFSPPSSIRSPNALGDVNNFLYGGHNKFTITTTSESYSVLNNMFTEQGTFNGAVFNDATTFQSLTVDFGGIVERVYCVGVNSQNYNKEIKIEYQDESIDWKTLFDFGLVEKFDVFWWDTSNYKSIQKIRISFKFTPSENETNFMINRVYAYSMNYQETFLPCAGGNIYGDLKLLGLKGAESLGTDEDGKLIAKSGQSGQDLTAIKSIADDYQMTNEDYTILVDTVTKGTDINITLPSNPAGKQKARIVNFLQSGTGHQAILKDDSTTLISIDFKGVVEMQYFDNAWRAILNGTT